MNEDIGDLSQALSTGLFMKRQRGNEQILFIARDYRVIIFEFIEQICLT